MNGMTKRIAVRFLAVLVVTIGLALPADAAITFNLPPGTARPDIHVEQLLIQYDGTSVLQVFGYNPGQPGLATPIEYRGPGGLCDPVACPFDQAVSGFSLTYDRNNPGASTYTLFGELDTPPNGTVAGSKTLTGFLTDVEWTPGNTLRFLGTVAGFNIPGSDADDLGFTTGLIGMQMVTDGIPNPPGGPFVGPDGWFTAGQQAFSTGANSLDFFGQVNGGQAAVPEPSTLALLGLGLAALTRLRRR